MSALKVLGYCIPTSDSGFTPSDAGRALWALDELIAAAKAMSELAKGPASGVSAAQKRDIIMRMDQAIARFGDAS